MTTATTNTFGERVQGYRRQLGMLQKTLAERSGLSPSHLNRIEKGLRSAPQVETVLRMIDALCLGFDEAEELVQLAGYSPLVLQGNKRTITEATISSDTMAEKDNVGVLSVNNVNDDSFSFPDSIDLEAELLADELRQIVQAPGISRVERDETVQLLKSFFAWLKFRKEK